ncbi:DUF397 domain-containing protein [Actinomadura adrarensis]|uniref:DUF397 domain-containing protein n=1 Tax=Actinomadura adrarensis TaxID=1819600 RepID=A0ABW3CSY2_9ACTN
MNTTGSTFTQWRKSSYSGGESGQCVEVAQAPGLVGIRDSKNRAIGPLNMDRVVFAALVSKVKAGDLDL